MIGDADDTVALRGALVGFARQAFELGERLEWKSYDPYDILLSPSSRLVRQRSPLAARVLMQVGRLSGSRLRRVLRIPRHEEPKALADFVQAAAVLARGGEGWATVYARDLSSRLRQRAVSGSAGRGWGNQFPSVSRFGSLSAGEPNTYTTMSVCHALLDDYDLEQRPASLEAAVEGVRFILNGLDSLNHAGRKWLRYAASLTGPIINIQASSAGLFMRMVGYRGDERLVEAADRAAEAVVASQRTDGSWTYSADERGAFVDGFHSGFTLQGLQEYRACRKEHIVPGAVRALELGFSYFKEHLLTPDGRPRGFADGRVSLDGQNVAQAIQTLLVCGDAADAEMAARMWRLGIQRRQLSGPRFPALRWSIGPSVLATAFLLRAAGPSVGSGGSPAG